MTQAGIIRFLIIGLPVGLIAGGVIAMKVYYKEQRTPNTGFGHVRKLVNRAEIQSHVEMLAGTIGSRHATTTPDRIKFTVKYLQSTLSPVNMGYNVFQHTYKTGDADNHDIAVEIPGSHPDHSGEVVLVGAHYDSSPDSPGADANASGVAAGLSLCQAFANTKHERTLRFVFFANGEGKEPGSLKYARDCKQRGEKIVAMISLHCLGFYSSAKGSQNSPAGLETSLPDAGNFLAVFGRANTQLILDVFKSSFSTNNTLPVAVAVIPESNTFSGAEAPFAQQDYPSVLVTDTAALRNPNVHQPADTPDTLDYERLTQAVRGVEGVLQILANPVRSAGGKS
jgi:hypothetical protein